VKKLSKVMCIILTLGMLLTALFTGCGQKDDSASTNSTTVATTPEASTVAEEPDKIDISKEVKLNLLVVGDPAKDWDAVLGEFNTMLKKDLNAELTTTFVGWADTGTKYPMMLMSGQDLDLVFVASWMDYQKHVQKGAFLPLDDYIQKLAPNASKKLPKEAWDDVLVDGKTYAVPRYKFEYQNWAGVAVRGSLMKKYGLTKIDNMEDFGKYLDAVKTNEKGLIPLNAAAEDWPVNLFLRYKNCLNYSDLNMSNGLYYDAGDEKPTVKCEFVEPSVLEAAKITRDWYNKGYWSKNILNNKVRSQDAFVNGQSASACLGLNEFNNNYVKWNTDHPDWDVQFYPFNPEGSPYYTASFNTTSLAVSITSKNPERCVMVMDKFYESEEYWNILSYGIKGTHWEPTSDGKIQVPAGKSTDAFPQFSTCPWGYGDFQGFHKASMNEWPGMAAREEVMFKNAKPTPLRGFVIKTDTIKNEIAAMEAVKTTYIYSYVWGTEEPEVIQKKAMDEMKKAGFEKVMVEIQKQIDEFMANKK
jgi:putative aldouronate transport system substrate-binding protein